MHVRLLLLVLALLATLLLPVGGRPALAEDVELPDLISVPPTRVQEPELVTWAGETSLVIRFDGHITNVGEGPLDLYGNPSTGSVAQRARTTSGNWVDVTSPQVIYETADGHNHWHLMKAARYSLWNETKTAEVAPGQKVGFCLYDVVAVAGAPVVDTAFYQGPVVRWCEVGNPNATQLRMGVSAGYQDVYDKSLTYQWVDVSNVQPGTYWVAAQIDPENVIVESSEANNTISFSAQSVTVPGYIARSVGPVATDGAPVVVDLEATQHGSPAERVFRIVTPPQHGTLNVSPGADIWGSSVTYTPDPGYEGPDNFTYVAADATSQYPRNPATAAVLLEIGNGLPPSVTISGAPERLIAGTSARLFANLVNAGDSVDWLVDGVPGGNATVGRIDGAGLYRAPDTPPAAASVTVRAQSRELPEVYGEVTIAIDQPLLPPVIAPAPGPQAGMMGDAVSLAVTATDGNGDPVRYWAQGLPPGLRIDEDAGVISGTLTSYGEFDVAVYATDGALSDRVDFRWTVEAQPPAVAQIANQTLAEGSTTTVDPQISDPYDLPYLCTLLAPSFVTKDGADRLTISPDYDDAGVYDVTLVVTNEGGASTSVSFTVAVENVNRPPVVGYLEDRQVAEGDEERIPVTATDPDGERLDVAVTGPPFAAWDASNWEVVLAPGFEDAGVFEMMLSVSDPHGATATARFDVVVENTNRPPTLTGIEDLSVAEGTTERVPIAAGDPDGQPVTLSVDGPSYVALDPGASQLVVAPGFGDAGPGTVVVIARDPEGAEASTTFIVFVGDVNRPPVVGPLSPVAADEGAITRIPLTVHDPDGDPVTFDLDAPPFVSIDAAASEIVVSPGFDDAGVYPLTVMVGDGRGASVPRTTELTVVDVNRDPELEEPADVVIGAGEQLAVPIAAGDPDGDPVTVSIIGPSFATYAEGAIELDPRPSDEGSHIVTIEVSDGRGGSITAAFTVEVYVTNRPPVIEPLSRVVLAEGEHARVEVTASDDGGAGLTWELDGPSWAVWDGEPGTIVLTPGFEASGLHEVGVTVTDDAGLAATTSFTVEVINTNRAPVIDPLPEVRLHTGAELRLDVAAHDADGDALVFAATGLPPGIAIDPDTGRLFGPLGFDAAGPHQVEISVTDGIATVTAVVALTVLDDAPEAVVTLRVTGRGERWVVELSGRNSLDPEGGRLRYFWDLDGDGRYDDARRWWARLEVGRGNHEVGLRVVDEAGNATATRTTITIP